MKHVDIYITHNLASIKSIRADYVYVICAETPKGEATLVEFGTDWDTTVNKINLSALESALGHFHSPAEITVYTDSPTLAGAFNCGNIKKWRENGFMTAKGKELVNADLWQQVAGQARRHIINAIHTRHHQYTNWAEAELAKKYGKAE